MSLAVPVLQRKIAGGRNEADSVLEASGEARSDVSHAGS